MKYEMSCGKFNLTHLPCSYLAVMATIRLFGKRVVHCIVYILPAVNETWWNWKRDTTKWCRQHTSYYWDMSSLYLWMAYSTVMCSIHHKFRMHWIFSHTHKMVLNQHQLMLSKILHGIVSKALDMLIYGLNTANAQIPWTPSKKYHLNIKVYTIYLLHSRTMHHVAKDSLSSSVWETRQIQFVPTGALLAWNSVKG